MILSNVVKHIIQIQKNGSIRVRSHYIYCGSYPTLATNRQKFSGKEDQTTVAGSSLPYLDFGARMYDAKLVRWNTYDPMAEKYYGINPYAYCNGDPVNMVDPDGNNWYSYIDDNSKTQYRYVEGKLSKEEIQEKGYKELGFTFTDENTGTYYGLFGNTISKDDNKDFERKISQKIDDLLIKYYTHTGKFEDFYLDVPVGDYHFEYKGESFSSDRIGTVFHRFNNQDNSYLTIGEMPSTQKKTRIGYYGRSYEGYFMILNNRQNYDAIQVMFDQENSLKFREAIDRLFK